LPPAISPSFTPLIVREPPFLNDADQLVGILVRQGPNQHGIDDAEDCRVRTDAQAERQDGDQRKSGRARERPNRVVQVLPQRREQRDAALLATGLDDLGDAAELTQCPVTRPVGRHPLPPELTDRFGDVGVDLGAQLAVTSGAAEQPKEPRQNDAYGADHVTPTRT
jgi:hypothetical protein